MPSLVPFYCHRSSSFVLFPRWLRPHLHPPALESTRHTPVQSARAAWLLTLKVENIRAERR